MTAEVIATILFLLFAVAIFGLIFSRPPKPGPSRFARQPLPNQATVDEWPEYGSDGEITEDDKAQPGQHYHRAACAANATARDRAQKTGEYSRNQAEEKRLTETARILAEQEEFYTAKRDSIYNRTYKGDIVEGHWN